MRKSEKNDAPVRRGNSLFSFFPNFSFFPFVSIPAETCSGQGLGRKEKSAAEKDNAPAGRELRPRTWTRGSSDTTPHDQMGLPVGTDDAEREPACLLVLDCTGDLRGLKRLHAIDHIRKVVAQHVAQHDLLASGKL